MNMRTTGGEKLDGWLQAELRKLEQGSGEVMTLANGKPNRIQRVDSSGVLISTEASEAKGSGPQLQCKRGCSTSLGGTCDPRAVSRTATYFRPTVSTSSGHQQYTLRTRLPGVEVVSSRPIELRFERASASRRGQGAVRPGPRTTGGR